MSIFVSDSRFPCLYTPKEDGGLVIPPGIRFLFVAYYNPQGNGGGI
jgi:hypothetical protein